MELLKEDKTLKASQRESGAGLRKRTEQREEITRWRAEIRSGVRKARDEDQTGFFSLESLQHSAFLFLVCLSEYILKGKKETIFVVHLYYTLNVQFWYSVSVPENIVTFAAKSKLSSLQDCEAQAPDPLASCPLHAALLPFPANLENLALATELEKISFHTSPKEGQCQRMFKLPHVCTNFTC